MKIGHQVIDYSRITLHEGLQFRAKFSEEVVERYVEAMERGVKFPPLTCYWDGETIWLADGHYTLEAHKRLGKTKGVTIELIPGTFDDAEEAAMRANDAHGSERKRADQRNVALRAIARHPDYSGAKIAADYGVSKSLANDLRLKATQKAEKARQIVDKGQPSTVTVDPEGDEKIASAGEQTESPAKAAADGAPESTATVAKANGKSHASAAEKKANVELEKLNAEMVAKLAALEDENKELRDSHESMRKELESANAALDALPTGGEVKAALAEARKYREQARIATERVRGMTNEHNEALAAAKRYKRRVHELEKAKAH